MRLYDYRRKTVIKTSEADPNKRKNRIKVKNYKCTNEQCEHRFHRMIPEGYLPYKQYPAEEIEKVIYNKLFATPETKVLDTCTADESTMWSWVKWFKENASFFESELLKQHFEPNPAKTEKMLLGHYYPTLDNFVDSEKKWLSKIVGQTSIILIPSIHSVRNDCPAPST